MTHAMQPDRVYNTRYRIVLPDGDTRVVYIQGEVVRDAAGQPTHIRGMVQDITEQERVKDALDQRVKELSNLQALSAVVSLSLPWEEVAQIYLQRIVTLADLDMAQLFLLKEDRLDLAGVHARMGVQVIPQTECVVGECLCRLAVTERRPLYAGDVQSDARCTRAECRAGALHSLLASPLHSGDAVFGVLVLGARARDAFAGKLAFLETAADQIAVRLQNALLHREIQERAAGLTEIVAERTLELQTERDRTQAILETVGESVIVTDLDGQVLFSNPATEALTGFSRDETLGQPIWRGWSAQALKDAWPQAQKTLCGGRPWQGEVTGCRKDGAPYVAALTGTPLYEERAATLATGGVWVQRDITAVKEVGRLRDQFVSNVSHELRTPISIITLSCDNLDAFYDRLDEGQRRQMLQDIHAQAHLLSDLVEDILMLSQIDGGRVSRRTGRIDLAHLVREEVERQQPRAECRSQRLSVAAGAPVFVPGNEVQLRRVMRNMLDNAIKYTPSGGWILCTCEIRAAGQAAAPAEEPSSTGSWAVVEVADGGIGIAAEDTRYLFERFHRVNSESDIPGTGLGLSIARELVVLHGGRITVASALGQGSIFTVYLPLGE